MSERGNVWRRPRRKPESAIAEERCRRKRRRRKMRDGTPSPGSTMRCDIRLSATAWPLIEDVAKVSLEASNSPRMVFSNYRELVRTADEEKWFAVTPETVEAVKAAREKSAAEKIVPIPVAAAP